MTPQQKRCLDYLVACEAQTPGIPPTFDSIRVYLGLKSNGGVTRLLDSLERQGLVKRTKYCRQSIRVTGCCPTCGRGAAA